MGILNLERGKREGQFLKVKSSKRSHYKNEEEVKEQIEEEKWKMKLVERFYRSASILNLRTTERKTRF